MRVFLHTNIWLLFACCWLGDVTPLFAQQYVIHAGDKLEITFWQEPELNTTTTVGRDGMIELPVIGRIKAAGLTTSELSEQIVDQISRYRIKVTQATVVVTEYQGNKIYITGQVGAPGTLSFEVIPNLWRALQEAGGLSETADLERVTIIRGGEESGDVIQVDLTEFLDQGDPAMLPKLRGGDTIHVPRIPSVRSGSDTPSSPFVSKNEIYILGEVASPGRYNLEKNVDLLDALILAGGPTNSARLSDVKVLKRWQGSTGMMVIDLKHYLNHSEPGPPPLAAGDTIFVPRKGGAASFILTRILIPVITSATVFLLVNTIR